MFGCLIAFFPMMVAAQKPIVVSQDGKGNFKTIQEAINSLPAEASEQRIILIKPGTYAEKIFIDKNFITLKGESAKNTVITISLARDEWRCGNADDYGTATLNLKGNDITLEGLSFINSYGKDAKGEKTIACPTDSTKTKIVKPTGHQMALRSFGTTRLIVKDCIFRAWGGDTVSPWNADEGMFYFYNCIMEGGVDFYCPRGWAYAENCRFICHSTEAAIWHDGSKHESSKTVLVNCCFSGDDGFKLGRYHRDAQFYLIRCHFPANMADADIYQRAANPPNTILWGRRVYYYGSVKEGKPFKWLEDNMPAGTSINDIGIPWTFDFKWKPEAFAGTLSEDLVANIPVATMEAAGTLSVQLNDPVADNMLLYQRSNGGWPKHFQGDKKVDYKRVLTDDEKKELQSGYAAGIDATIDNEATTKEIRYLAKAYKSTPNLAYLEAAKRGIAYLLKAQYDNGGWPQYFPDFSSYRSQVTYNDNAMVNVLNVLNDLLNKKNDLEVLGTDFDAQCSKAIQKGIDCILKTQLSQNGKHTAWCAQYNAKTLKPEMARKFELESLSGMESVAIVRFLMQVKEPSADIKEAVTSAVEWFNKVKITGYKFIDVPAPNEKSGRDRVLVPDSSGGVIWARFYDINTNEPFFSGRDSQRKKTVAEIENERRIGYAWYGTWPAKLLATEYPAWLQRINKQ